MGFRGRNKPHNETHHQKGMPMFKLFGFVIKGVISLLLFKWALDVMIVAYYRVKRIRTQ